MSAIVMPTEEECLPCSRCGEAPRMRGGRNTWCRECKQEWQRQYRQGVKRFVPVSPPVRDERGCLIWQGYVHPNGYGRLTRDGRSQWLHIWVYEQHHGPVPAGLTVDHTCENKLCTEPSHLDVCTRGQNVRRYFLRRAFA